MSSALQNRPPDPETGAMGDNHNWRHPLFLAPRTTIK